MNQILRPLETAAAWLTALGIGNPATDTQAGILETATQAEQETATAVDKIVTPGRQQFHPSAAKVWVQFNPSGGLGASYNVTSVTDNSVGNWTVVIATDFSSNSFVGLAIGGYEAATGSLIYNVGDTLAAGAFRVIANARATGASADPDTPNNIFVVCFGDQ
jgi:hypothetical protein